MNLLAGNARPRSIEQLARDLGLDAQSVEPYGWFAGKFALDLHLRLQQNPMGHLIGVTAINPTSLGEGKTIVSIGLAMALSRRGYRSIVNVREPSLAPVFGIKGGGAGGGGVRGGAVSRIRLSGVRALKLEVYGASDMAGAIVYVEDVRERQLDGITVLARDDEGVFSCWAKGCERLEVE